MDYMDEQRLVGRTIREVTTDERDQQFGDAWSITLALDDGYSVTFRGVWLNTSEAKVGWEIEQPGEETHR